MSACPKILKTALKALFYGLALVVFPLAGLAAWMYQPFVTAQGALARAEDAPSPARLRQHVEFLAGTTAKRHFAHPAVLERAGRYVEGEFRQSGARVASEPYGVEGETFRNVVARFGPPGPPAVVVGAHYDVEEHTPGADDNASGVAALLEIAAALGRRPPAVAVELVAYSLEEPPHFATPHMGSRHHAARLAREGARPALILVLEMIGYYDAAPGSQSYPLPGLGLLYPQQGDFLALVGPFSAPGPVRRVKGQMARQDLPVYSINAPAFVPGVDFSDHASYWAHGLPALMLTDTAFYRNPHYHKPGDLPATLDYEKMGHAVQGLVAVIRSIDTPGAAS